jgi:hypothetical protein
MAITMLDVGVSRQWLYDARTGEPRVFTISDLREFPAGVKQGDYGQLGSRSFRYALVPGVGDTSHRLWVPPEIYDDSLRVEAFATGAESPLALASQGWVVSLDSGGLLASKGDFLELTAPQVLEGNSISQLLPEYGEPAYIQCEYIAVAGAGSAWGLTQIPADMDLPAISYPYPFYFTQSHNGYLAHPDTKEKLSVNTLSVFSEVGLFGAVVIGSTKSYAKLMLRNIFIVSA